MAMEGKTLRKGCFRTRVQNAVTERLILQLTLHRHSSLLSETN